ncbi:MAG: abortive infection family protein [Methanospirillum sp.]
MDYDATIRASVSMLESALKQCQLSLTVMSKGDTLTSLWKPTTDLLKLDDVGGLYDIGVHLSSIIFAVAGLRNQWSDAHGKADESKKTPYIMAELAFFSTCVTTTFVVRRFHQIAVESKQSKS